MHGVAVYEHTQVLRRYAHKRRDLRRTPEECMIAVHDDLTKITADAWAEGDLIWHTYLYQAAAAYQYLLIMRDPGDSRTRP